MKVNVIRGSGQIGGSIIEISTDKTKIILDAGLELEEGKNKTLPNIPSLFEYKGYDGVFITHYHMDHMGLAYNIHKDIPLYLGEKSAKIINASDKYKRVQAIKPSGFLQDNKKITIGDIEITPYLCDHSAFDSYMLLCRCGKESVLYTGDFRSNGRKSYESLLSRLPKKVDKLICEGTTLSRKDYAHVKEVELEEKATEVFKGTKGPIFVLQSSMNIDRIVTMYRAAKRSKRLFLQELYMADITSSAGKSIPNPAFNDVYAFITSSSRYEGLKKYEHRMGIDRIAKQKFVMCVRTSMIGYIKKLVEKTEEKEGVLVYSFWEGYKENEDMKLFLNECQNLGLKIVNLHTSGHADYESIKRLVERVNPKELIPVHTEAPNRLRLDRIKS